jgi:hypothetical protein
MYIARHASNKMKTFVLRCSAMLALSLVSARVVATEEIQQLAPVVVEETKPPRPYLYVEVPGFEILSVFPMEQTKAIAEALQRQRASLSLVIPVEFQAPAGMPEAMIFDERAPADLERFSDLMLDVAKAVARESHRPFNDGNRDPLAGIDAEEAQRKLSEMRRGIPILRGATYSANREAIRESLAVVRGETGLLNLGASSSGMNVRTAHAPAPDRALTFVNVHGIEWWRTSQFSAGQDEPELRGVFPITGLVAGRRPRFPSWFERQLVGDADGAGMFFARFFTPIELRVMAKPAAVKLLPGLTVEEAFAEHFRPEDAVLHRDLAQVFMTWALLDEKPARAAAFWKFVDRATRAPVTSAMFAECFGPEGWSEFVRYCAKHSLLRGGTLEERFFRLKKPPVVTAPVIHPATRAESVRIRSEYEWRIGREFGAAVPELAAQCFNQAGRRLRKAYADGERDPQFLATLALFEADAGKAAEAPALLEAAAATHVVRPWLYTVLARTRFVAARAKLASPTAKFAPDQAHAILEPLLIARGQRPVLPEIYHLAAEVWARSAEAPGPVELAALAEGVAMFPGDAALASKVAVLHLQAGARREAAAIVAQGLVWRDLDPAVRARLEKLQQAASAEAK